MAKPKKSKAETPRVKKPAGAKAIIKKPRLPHPHVDDNTERQFIQFLVNNADFYSLFGYWIREHDRFMLYSINQNKCTQMWHVYHWDHDQPTTYTCHCQGANHPIVQAFFRHH